MIGDLRYAWRTLSRTPGFALVVILTLALGIGANVTAFSVLHAVLWRSLPYPDSDRLVVLDAEYRGVQGTGVSDAEASDLREQHDLFTQVASIAGVDAHLAIDGEMERVAAASATDDALAALGGLPVALGRRLEAARDSGSQFVSSVVISDELWRRRFRSDPAAVGRHIEVNNLDVEIIGVLRPGFRVFLPARAGTSELIDVWFPRKFSDDALSRGHSTIARLASAVTVPAAQARLDALAPHLVAARPAHYPDRQLRLRVDSLQDVLTTSVRPALWVLAGAVAFVLLIGCANVANLMLARGRQRATELALRSVLGAGRARLLRQLLAETAVLAVFGAGAGFVLAYWGVQLVDWLRPSHLPRQSQIAVNGTVVLYTFGLSVVVSVVCGLLPALRQTWRSNEQVLRAGRSGAQRSDGRQLQRGLVLAEVALSIVPLVAAGLMLRSFVNLTRAPLGFDPLNVITADMPFSFRAFPDPAQRWTLHRNALDRVRQLPGVTAVSAGSPLPFDSWQYTNLYGRDGDPAEPRRRASVQTVLPGYLAVVGTTLRAGRDFTDDDLTQRRPVVIVDERLANQLWPEGAIGKRLAVQRGSTFVPLEVIGVTNPVRMTAARDEPMPHMFVPYSFFGIQMTLVVKSTESAVALGPAIKKAVESLGTRRPVHDIRPMQSYVDQSIGDTRFTMLVLIGFGAASLLLAGVGLYGTLTYLTSQRTQEFGVRMALGASANHIVGAVVREAGVLTMLGVGAGLAGASAVTGAIRGLLYDVAPFDAATLIGVAALVAAVGIIAAGHPAWRAAKVDPVTALRAE